MYERTFGTLVCVRVCMTIKLNYDFKVKLLVLKHQALNAKETILVLKRCQDFIRLRR